MHDNIEFTVEAHISTAEGVFTIKKPTWPKLLVTYFYILLNLRIV